LAVKDHGAEFDALGKTSILTATYSIISSAGRWRCSYNEPDDSQLM
jgi:hypothetical protein